MLLIKSGNDLYWDGEQFQPDYRSAVIFTDKIRAEIDLRYASRIDAECKLEVLKEPQRAEIKAVITKVQELLKGAF
jgi:hypothetical protein